MVMSFVNKQFYCSKEKKKIPLHIHWNSDNQKIITILGGHRKIDTVLVGI